MSNVATSHRCFIFISRYIYYIYYVNYINSIYSLIQVQNFMKAI
jgi:hypothetical protein